MKIEIELIVLSIALVACAGSTPPPEDPSDETSEIEGRMPQEESPPAEEEPPPPNADPNPAPGMPEPTGPSSPPSP
jgi:hypothetical protein